MIAIDEGKHLANSIDTLYDRIHRYHEIMYSATVAILTYGFSQKEPLIFIIPLVLIAAIVYMIRGIEKDICKIAEYITMFEKYTSEWHKRVWLYSRETPKTEKRKSSVMYRYMILLCGTVAIASCFLQDIPKAGVALRIICIVFASWKCIEFCESHILDYVEEGEIQRQNWERVKKQESL